MELPRRILTLSQWLSIVAVFCGLAVTGVDARSLRNTRDILGLCRDSGKENGNYYSMQSLEFRDITARMETHMENGMMDTRHLQGYVKGLCDVGANPNYCQHPSESI